MESPDEVIEGSGEEETTGKRSKLKIKIWKFSGFQNSSILFTLGYINQFDYSSWRFMCSNRKR